ncbi:M56 family metallopeptidase [Clostridium grantii]|uniref:Signal transducer regulating beta-lactamase production, contains metallopeptidase domain n=1 Tax=Clostridium grantii DSM 8605 TaxID=1121316 RepID=A0A1M5Y150_9CLOT|nr:M56 family metallopeptidase [Clostridium grantii]SHI05795.1 Signal transducer regulating beta-lactamase production, contains metallopeptidase domain [Clostridium grantii DSM 8605]
MIIESIFIKILNMSFIASYVVLAIILLRVFLRKSPKIYSYILWGIAFLRMTCFFSFKSIISLIPTESNVIDDNIGYMKSPEIYSGISSVDSIASNLINNNLPPVNEVASVNPMQIVIYIASNIWLIGIIIILIYSIISYIRLYKGVSTATLVEKNIYETDRITTAFVLGFINPRIFLPIGIKDKNYEYITSHEKTHMIRKDHIIKPLYFMAVVFHWFNPLMWISYYLMTKDMEMSCDEKVMNLKGNNMKNDYAKLLLDLSVKQSSLLSPIAFGENNTKSRIKTLWEL